MQSSLWKINSEYLKLVEELEESEGVITDEIGEKLMISEQNLDVACNNLVGIIRSRNAFNNNIQSEIERLTKIKNTNDRMVELIKNSIKDTMKLRGIKKIPLETGAITLVDSKSVSIEGEPSSLPVSYTRITAKLNTDKVDKNFIGKCIKESIFESIKVEPNKTLLSSLLKEGVAIEGVELISNPYLKIT